MLTKALNWAPWSKRRKQRSPGDRARIIHGKKSVLSAAVIMTCPALLVSCTSQPGTTAPDAQTAAAPQSDQKAVDLINRMIERIGGMQAWDNTRIIAWQSFDRRQHTWDKQDGVDRIGFDANGKGEANDHYVVILSTQLRTGEVWKNGQKVLDPFASGNILVQAYDMWFSDHLWISLPFDLGGPGVKLTYAGSSRLPDGRAADRVQAVFPDREGQYKIDIAQDSHVMEHCAYFASAADAQPVFSLDWNHWERYGHILLSDDHGPGRRIKGLSVYSDVPETVWTSPEPVDHNRWNRQ